MARNGDEDRPILDRFRPMAPKERPQPQLRRRKERPVASDDLLRRDFAQLNIRVSPAAWDRLAQLQRHFDGLSQNNLVELLIRDRWKQEGLHLPPPPLDTSPLVQQLDPRALDENDMDQSA
jgi:hypothetical protein